MAANHQISVSVLDGAFVQLSKVGVPMPVCFHLQEQGLHLRSANWTARQSSRGFSVCFFWPAQKVITEQGKAKKKRKRRTRKNASTTGHGAADGGAQQWGKHPEGRTSAPIDAHHHVADQPCPEEPRADCSESDSTEYENTDDDIKLVECDPVVVEMRQDTVGVKFTKEGEEGWTPGGRGKDVGVKTVTVTMSWM